MGKQTSDQRSSGPKQNIRSLALYVIMQTLEEGKYCDRVLHRVLEDTPGLSKQDRSFLTRLSEGTIERCIELDYILNQFSKVKVHKMKPVIRCILRMAVYQFLYMDQVPNRAACDEAVKLTVRRRMQGLRGFVNGVLREIDRKREEIPYPDASDFVPFVSVRYSIPEWIVLRLLQNYTQQQVLAIAESFLEKEHTTSVRCNLFLGNRSEKGEDILAEDVISDIRASLERQGVMVEAGRLFPYAFRISGYDRLSSLDMFRSGSLQVQDESSMVVGAVSGIKEGQTVLDVCAAPGGKSIHAADLLRGTGVILSCDLSEAKVRLIQENMERTGVEHCELYRQDARILRKDWIGSVDVLIADLPCSGLGVLGKKCDIKYHTKPEDCDTLCRLQREILQVVSRYIRPGGTLLFSTCTIVREENEENVMWIRENLPFVPVSIEEELPEELRGKTGKEGYLQILPTDGTDGFFIAKFRKEDEQDG